MLRRRHCHRRGTRSVGRHRCERAKASQLVARGLNKSRVLPLLDLAGGRRFLRGENGRAWDVVVAAAGC
jgi:hypothetical protein